MSRRTRVSTLADFFSDSYLPSARARKRSWKTDEGIFIRHILPHLGNRKITRVTFGDVAAWLEGRSAAGYAPATCNRMLAVLRAVFSLALQRGDISGRSPCAGVRPFRVPGGRERFLGRGEARRLFDELGRRPCQEAAAVRLLLLTGARKGEIIRARWRDVDLERRILTVPISKSGRPRHIHLSAAAVAVLRRLSSKGCSDWLFPSRKPDRPITDIFYFWSALRRRLNLDDVRIHDLRHTFASILVSSGQSLFVAQALLGHRSPAATMRYAHLNDRPLRNAVESVGRYLETGAARREN